MADQPALQPEVKIACDACGETAAEEVASSTRARLPDRARAPLSRCALDPALARSSSRSAPASLTTTPPACSPVASLRPPLPVAAARGEIGAERLRARALCRRAAAADDRVAAIAVPAEGALARARVSGRAPRVLEVGSFVGGFLHEARTSGLQAIGIDPNEQMVELIAARGSRSCPRRSRLSRPGAACRRFDAVVIWSTFDQLTRPRAALAAALRVLRPAGLLLLRFPHGACFRRLGGVRSASGSRAGLEQPAGLPVPARIRAAIARRARERVPDDARRVSPGTRWARSPTRAMRTGHGSKSGW